MLQAPLKKLLAYLEERPRLRPIYTLVEAIDTFSYEVDIKTKVAPHIRDSVDLKRWMVIVILALLPACIVAVINSGMGAFVYSSSSSAIYLDYLKASQSFSGYFGFLWQHLYSILWLGLKAFVPLLIISYTFGAIWEVWFASAKGHPISEGLLVTGILFALILPPTIPYWMAAVGISVGIILSKELFGGTGMNLLNPALTCRCFLYFSFPNKMSGDVWVGLNPQTIRSSLSAINDQLKTSSYDMVTQVTNMGVINVNAEVKRIHIETIAAAMNFTKNIPTKVIEYFENFKEFSGLSTSLDSLSLSEMAHYLSTKPQLGGLGLSNEYLSEAIQFAKLKYGIGLYSNTNLFFGNTLGSLGETSVLACLIGAIILLVTKVGSFRTMLSIIIGAFATASILQFANYLGVDAGLWNPAKYDIPAYKQFFVGSLAFGLVFMATDPVSSPDLPVAKWIYGLLIGSLTVIIRLVNPAFPEGVMLAILFANVFAPLFDRYAMKQFRKQRMSLAKKVI